MLSTANIINLSQSSQLGADSFTGSQQIVASSWSGILGMDEIARRSERCNVYAAMCPVENLKPETNHKDNLGGAQ